MKKYLLLISVVLVSLGFYTVNMVEKNLKQILSQLKLNDNDAAEYVWADISGCNFGYPYSDQLRKTPMSDRPVIVSVIADFAKQYTRSEEFQKRYLEYRESMKPEPPEPPQSVDEMKQKSREQLTASISSLEETMKNYSKEQREEFSKTIDELKRQLKEIDDPANPMYGSDTQNMIQQNYEQQKNEYMERLAQWEKDYPVNNNKALVKKWLEKFLSETDDIDFNAALKDNGYGRKIFVNPDYESKSSTWKLCYRTGKAATDAARSYAASWLKELK